MSHFCPAPRCGVRVPAHKLACAPHWFRIPKELRDQLLREYHENFGETSYFEARAACLRALGVPEHEIADVNAGVS